MNAPSSNHPEWAAVGSTVRVIRQFSHSGPDHIVHEHTSVVARHTPTLIILESGEKYRRTHPVDERYHLTPRYLDYRTTLRPVAP